MAKLLIKCLKPYHSYIWPHAQAGETRWGDENLMAKLTRDSGGGNFSILAVEDDRGALTKTMPNVQVPPKAEEAQEPPKKKRGRPRKNPIKE